MPNDDRSTFTSRWHHLCATCGERIGVYEPIWLEHADGTFSTTSVLSLHDELSAPDEPVRLHHLGCVAIDQGQRTEAG